MTEVFLGMTRTKFNRYVNLCVLHFISWLQHLLALMLLKWCKTGIWYAESTFFLTSAGWSFAPWSDFVDNQLFAVGFKRCQNLKIILFSVKFPVLFSILGICSFYWLHLGFCFAAEYPMAINPLFFHWILHIALYVCVI